jgi:hypothetical protein
MLADMARRRRKGKAGAGLDAQARAFVNGTVERAVISIDPRKIPRGPGFVLGRSSGTGAHGKSGRARSRHERQEARRELRAER